MAENDQTPKPADQLSAGGTAQPANPGSIIDALRSRGAAPQTAIDNMLSPRAGGLLGLVPPPPMPPVNLGLAIGSGSLAAMPGGPGGNPYLAQQQQQVDAGYRQREQMQRWQDEQQARQDRLTEQAFERDKFTLQIEAGVLDKMDPSSPLYPKVAGEYAQHLSKLTRNPTYGQLGAAIATKELTTTQIDSIRMDGAKHMDPELIAIRNRVPVDRVKKILAMDPANLERLGAADAQELQEKTWEHKKKQDAAFKQDFPEFVGKDGEALMGAVQKLFGKVALRDATDEDKLRIRNELIPQARRALLAQEGERVLDTDSVLWTNAKGQHPSPKMTNYEAADRGFYPDQTALATRKGSAGGGKLVGEMNATYVDERGNPAPSDLPVSEVGKRGYNELKGNEQSLLPTYKSGSQMLVNLAETTRLLRDAGGLRTAGGARGVWQRGVLGYEKYAGDPAGVGGLLTTWDGQKSQLISLFRQLGEKGNIAAKMMIPQLEAMNPTAGYEAISRQLKMIESELRAQVVKSKYPKLFEDVPTVGATLNSPAGTPSAGADTKRPTAKGPLNNDPLGVR